jgi:surface antigen
VSGLTPAASSFTRVPGYRPGATNDPRVGDAIVWGGGGHVGIVVEVSSPTRIRVTAGNVSNRVTTEWLDPRTKRYNGGGVVGYTTPSPA